MSRRPDRQENLLSTVARKLGHAAGTLANLANVVAKDAAAKGKSTELRASGKTQEAQTTRRRVRARKQRRRKPGTKRAHAPRATAFKRRGAGKKRTAGRKARKGRTQ